MSIKVTTSRTTPPMAGGATGQFRTRQFYVLSFWLHPGHVSGTSSSTSPTHCRAALRLYPQAVAPHLGSFVPALADMAVGDRSKEARHYADRALRHALQIYDVPNGLEMAQAVLKAGLGPRPLYMSNQSQPKASGRAPERILGTMNLENL